MEQLKPIKNTIRKPNLSKINLKYEVGIIKLVWLRGMTNKDLIEIILLREQMINNRMNEWQDSLKYNDRKVFKNLREHNEELLDTLLNEKPFIKKLLDRIDNLKRKVNEYKIRCDPQLKKH